MHVGLQRLEMAQVLVKHIHLAAQMPAQDGRQRRNPLGFLRSRQREAHPRMIRRKRIELLHQKHQSADGDEIDVREQEDVVVVIAFAITLHHVMPRKAVDGERHPACEALCSERGRDRRILRRRIGRDMLLLVHQRQKRLRMNVRNVVVVQYVLVIQLPVVARSHIDMHRLCAEMARHVAQLLQQFLGKLLFDRQRVGRKIHEHQIADHLDRIALQAQRLPLTCVELIEPRLRRNRLNRAIMAEGPAVIRAHHARLTERFGLYRHQPMRALVRERSNVAVAVLQQHRQATERAGHKCIGLGKRAAESCE